jgi:hypothetical protein
MLASLIGGWKVNNLVFDNWLRWMICWTPWSKRLRDYQTLSLYFVYMWLWMFTWQYLIKMRIRIFFSSMFPLVRAGIFRMGGQWRSWFAHLIDRYLTLTVKYCWTLLYCFLQNFFRLFNERFATWTHIQSILHSSRISGLSVINKSNILQSFLIILLLHIWERINHFACYLPLMKLEPSNQKSGSYNSLQVFFRVNGQKFTETSEVRKNKLTRGNLPRTSIGIMTRILWPRSAYFSRSLSWYFIILYSVTHGIFMVNLSLFVFSI